MYTVIGAKLLAYAGAGSVCNSALPPPSQWLLTAESVFNFTLRLRKLAAHVDDDSGDDDKRWRGGDDSLLSLAERASNTHMHGVNRLAKGADCRYRSNIG